MKESDIINNNMNRNYFDFDKQIETLFLCYSKNSNSFKTRCICKINIKSCKCKTNIYSLLI